ATVIGTNNPAQTVTWASSDPAVATVSASGLVTAVANGAATITAASAINTSKKGAVAVTVAPPTPIAPPAQPNGNTNVIDHENNFWISVVSLIQSTKKGDVLKIDTGAYTQMPACVMEELRIKGAGMIIKWNGGKNIVIPIGKALCAEKNRDVWALAELAKMYNKYSLGNKTNPTTGVDTYEIVDNKTGATTPIIGNIVDTTATQGGQTGKYILVVLAGTLVAAVAVFGVCIWTRKKEKEENEE
ncbi:MAG: Ig-like domain-containing protein, partial [Oscillospiraceae bacterium]